VTVLVAHQPASTYNVVIAGGRVLHLHSLYQTRTYKGLLAGRPNRESNKRIITDAFELARERLRFMGVPQLIPSPTVNGSPQSDYERLPDFLCIGEFTSPQPARDLEKPYSSAVFVWFQDSFAPPIAAEVLEEIRDIDWTRIAQDWRW
jgi:hypothetical protein